MKLYYYRHAQGVRNFGDELNTWIWEKFMPGVFDNNDQTLFIGIGTILSKKYLPFAQKNVVFSSGTGYSAPPDIGPNWKIYCVRGPLTAKKLGIALDLALTDGAVLVREFLAVPSRRKFLFSYMPHLSNGYYAQHSLKQSCHDLGFQYIDPQWPVEKVLSALTDTQYLITEALHGAIVADALRVPWVAVKTTANILQFKWEDWCASMELSYRPHKTIPLWDLEQDHDLIKSARHWMKAKILRHQLGGIVKNGRFALSSDERLNQVITEFKQKRGQFQRDLKAGIFN